MKKERKVRLTIEILDGGFLLTEDAWGLNRSGDPCWQHLKYHAIEKKPGVDAFVQHWDWLQDAGVE